MQQRTWWGLGVAFALAGSLLLGMGPSLAAPTHDGDLDPTFGSGGKVMTDFRGGNDYAKAAAVQPDGKIVVAGSAEGTGDGDYALARYNPDGTLDSNFGTEGRVTTDFEGKPDSANALMIQPDGKIVEAGSYDDRGFVFYEPSHGFGLVRYLPDGQLDPGFGVGGKVMTDINLPNGGGVANAIAFEPDGKIVVAGSKITGRRPGYSFYEFAVGRYNLDGTLDSSFGDGGLVFTSFGDPEPYFTEGLGYAVGIQADGKIVVGGSISSGAALARYNTDGSLDLAFGDAGLVRSAELHIGATSLLVESDGKILAGGADLRNCTPGPCEFEFALARYLPDGTLDPDFGTNGIATSYFAGVDSQVNGLAQQTDGRIIAAGSLGQPFYSATAFGLVRFDSDGSVDPSFGNAGQISTAFGGASAGLGVALQADGKIVAAGYGSAGGSGTDFAVARYENAAPRPPTPTIGPGCLFSDVCPGDYFFAGVQMLLARGAVSGYADQTFRPYNSTTRAQMVKIVALGFAIPPTQPPGGQYTFADVLPSFPFFPYIETAAAHNIVGGYACGSPGEPCDDQQRPYFRPAADVTRGQLAKIVDVAAGWPLVSPPAPGTFEDVPPASPFYTFVETAAAQNILSGYACGLPGEPCDPQHRPYIHVTNAATRGQIAKIVANALTVATPTPALTRTATAAPVPSATSTAIPPLPSSTATATERAPASATVTPTSAVASPTGTATGIRAR